VVNLRNNRARHDRSFSIVRKQLIATIAEGSSRRRDTHLEWELEIRNVKRKTSPP
jgi:hypothetical protein